MPSIETQQSATQIQLLILDVDGVLTDGRLWYSEQGEHLKSFHALDGQGIKMLQNTGIPVAIISGRKTPIVSIRMQELGITHIYQGQQNKIPAFEALIQKLDIKEKAVAYIGDDLPDIPILKRVGLAIAVANAVDAVKQVAHWQTSKTGGFGAVREACDLILASREITA